MKQLKLVDSLNKVSQIRHIEACNWYICKCQETWKKRKELDNIGKEEYNNNIKIISITHHG